jgi:hypothetical protein
MSHTFTSPFHPSRTPSLCSSVSYDDPVENHGQYEARSSLIRRQSRDFQDEAEAQDTTSSSHDTDESMMLLESDRDILRYLSYSSATSHIPVDQPEVRTNATSSRATGGSISMFETSRQITRHSSYSSAASDISGVDQPEAAALSDLRPETIALMLQTPANSNGSPNDSIESVDDDDGNSTLSHATWLPYTLRRPFLVSLAIVSLILSINLAILCWYSNKHGGLGKDDGSISLLFGRRYTPTFIAVLFTQAIVKIAEDIARTEAYSRMARPDPAKAQFTLLHAPRMWLISMIKGLSRKRSGGHKEWILATSSLAVGVSLLVISTLSSSIFISKDVLSEENIQLQRYTIGTPIMLKPRRDTYVHTISAFLSNVSTSNWISDSHAIVPFAVALKNSTHTFPDETIMKVDTKVIQVESNCVPMVMTEKLFLKNISFTYHGLWKCNGRCEKESKGFIVRSEDGFEVQLQSPILYPDETNFGPDPDGMTSDKLMTTHGGVLWTNISKSYVSMQDLVVEHGKIPPLDSSGGRVFDQWSRVFIYSVSDRCLGRELLLVTPPWSAPYPSHVDDPPPTVEQISSEFMVRAVLCNTTYHEANISASSPVTGFNRSISFDTSEHGLRRSPILIF